MSLSLSSLLNPADGNGGQPSSPPLSRKDSQPSVEQGAQVHEEQQQQLSASPVSTRSAQAYVQPNNTAHEAAQALAALSASPGLASSQWIGNGLQDQSQSGRRFSNERRPGSAYGEPIQLPPPPPQSDASRKMSSPTLEQYQVASRSPEQRRSSVVSPTQSNITLPPIQTLSASQAEHVRHTSFSMGRELPNIAAHDSSSGEAALHVISPAASAVDQVPLVNIPSQFAPSPRQSKPEEEGGLSPAIIKQEKMSTPQPPSPVDGRRASDVDQQTSKTVAALKTEHSARTHSPLRESSIPLPTTEVVQPEQPATTKKRPASAKTKKGTATTMKRAPPAKKRKVETVRSATPLSHISKSNSKAASGKGTPANSSPAPSTRSQSVDPNEEAYDDDEDEEMEDDPDADVYCICRRPDNGTFMIGCDGTCDDWFHGKCVSINERDKNLIDKYICPNCTQAGIGRTTWKRMCRRNGCRQPAKVGKTKGGGSSSKYCSDECGVLYYRELAERTRGREEAGKSRSSRRKSSMNHADKPYIDDDLGARGGVLSAGEVKALLNVSKNVDEFHRLGDGVLSPPATPDGKEAKEFTESEQQSLAKIHTQKENARHRHALLKDRMQFVTMVKQAASRTAAEKELKPKEYCGYDPRLEWTEEQFQHWRKSRGGEQAFEQKTLAVESGTNGDAMDVDGAVAAAAEEDAECEICDRKKCARHLEWSKLAVDDLRFEMSDNGDRMRALDREEKTIRERAALRAKAGEIAGEGTVEVHELSGGSGLEAAAAALGLETAPKLDEQSVMETVETVEPMAIDAS